MLSQPSLSQPSKLLIQVLDDRRAAGHVDEAEGDDGDAHL